MKVIRIYFTGTMLLLGHKSSIEASNHKIDKMDIGYLIDGRVFVPYSSCREVLVETEAFYSKAANSTMITMFNHQEQELNTRVKKKAHA